MPSSFIRLGLWLRRAALVFAALPCLASAQSGIVAKKDLAYADTDEPHQMLDLYLPEKPKDGKPLPLVIYIHGGAWRSGDKSEGGKILAGLVASGEYAGASIAYRFTDQQRWPAQIYDCKAAVRYLRAHAKEFGLDADHFAVSGASAGGHLALLVGLDGDTRTLEGDLGPYPKESSKVSCVLNWFGPVQLETMTWPSAMFHGADAVPPQDQLFGKPAHEHVDLERQASPVTYITAGDPPVFTAHGTVDPLVPFSQAVLLDESLKKAGVPSYFTAMEGAGHGFGSAELNGRVVAFLGHYLRDSHAEIATTPLPGK